MKQLCLLCLILAAPFLAAGECQPIRDLDGELRPGVLLLFGELHGTEQSPAFVAEVACHATERGIPTVVGFEWLAEMQPLVDAYLNAEESAVTQAESNLLAHPLWTRDYQDGRNSRAMFALVRSLRQLKATGADVEALLFDDGAAKGGQDRERKMARRVANSARAKPKAVHLVLTGNLHSRVGSGNARNGSKPMGGWIAEELGGRERLRSFNVAHEGGSSWICAPDCGVAQLRGGGSGEAWSIVTRESDRPAGHDGWYAVGTISASVPMIGDYTAPQQSFLSTPKFVPAPVPKEERTSLPKGSDEVKRMQGDWVAYLGDDEQWSMKIDGRGFYADVGASWYSGTIYVRPGDPFSELDFLIEECDCSDKEEFSDGIYRWQGEAMILSAPTPSSPRPTSLAAGSAVPVVRMLRR